MSILSDVAGGFFGTEYLRDYSHASKAFRTNNYALSPKLKFEFYVVFERTSTSGTTNNTLGLLVKSVKLPSYAIDTHAMNQYNRKRLIQTKIRYEDIEIEFHDDRTNMVNNLWDSYSKHYFNDGILAGDEKLLASRDPYSETTTQGWGSNPNKEPFFKSITVYSLTNTKENNCAQYTLINPVITRFSHDSHSYADAGGTMQSTMTIAYETVKYKTLSLSEAIASRDDSKYDKSKSPLSKPGGQNSIFGTGGLLDAAGGLKDIFSKDNLSIGDILNAGKIVGTTINTFKNTDLKQTVLNEVMSTTNSVLTGTPNLGTDNRTVMFNFPSGVSSVVNTIKTNTSTVLNTKIK